MLECLLLFKFLIRYLSSDYGLAFLVLLRHVMLLVVFLFCLHSADTALYNYVLLPFKPDLVKGRVIVMLILSLFVGIFMCCSMIHSSVGIIKPS